MASFYQLSPIKLSDNILQCVSSSNLHFSIQETPYSIYITVRKKYINENLKINVFDDDSENQIKRVEVSDLKQKCEHLLQENEELKNLLDEKESECNTFANLSNDVGMKLERAKVELSEAIKKKIEVVTQNEEHLRKLNNCNQKYKEVSDELIRSKTANDNLVMELKQVRIKRTLGLLVKLTILKIM